MGSMEVSANEEVNTAPSETPAIGGRRRFSMIRDGRAKYEWKKFAPDGLLDFCRWLVSGFSSSAQLSEEEVEDNFRALARMLMLLREYESRFGIPEVGGSRDQQWALKELCSQLYASGTPIWVLQPVMERAAEGLTGARGVNFLLLPRAAFIFAPSSGAMTMFRMERGFHMQRVTILERILVRLASFGSNTSTVNSVKYEFPNPERLQSPPRGESAKFGKHKDELAKDILDLASERTGLFFYTHAQEYPSSLQHVGGLLVDPFWHVEDSIRELFTRLAANEAEALIDAAVDEVKQATAKNYPMSLVILSRVLSSAGATGLWFSGSWQDMLIAGTLAIIVALVQGSTLWKHERVIFEVIISFVIGFAAGLISLHWPESTCFGAIAVGAVVDILQGFKIVYAIMELMSKHTLAGGADFMEAFLFTGLIASFLKLGQLLATSILGGQANIEIASTQCQQPIDEIWYILIMPITSLAWAFLFMPRISDLIGMALHGILSFAVYYVVQKASNEALLSSFLGALSVTLSAGILSRFTGRQALGDTVTGLYVLVPGAYLTRGLFEATSEDGLSASLLYNIIVNSVVIGLGAWSGTMLCSPTILGTNRGLMSYSKAVRNSKDPRRRGRGSSSASDRSSPILFF